MVVQEGPLASVSDLVASRITGGDSSLWGPDAESEAAIRLGGTERADLEGGGEDAGRLLGRQRSAGDTSKRARMLEVGVETPRWKDTWLRLDAGYTDTPVLTDTGTDSYSYRYLRLQAFVAF